MATLPLTQPRNMTLFAGGDSYERIASMQPVAAPAIDVGVLHPSPADRAAGYRPTVELSIDDDGLDLTVNEAQQLAEALLAAVAASGAGGA